MLPHKLPTPHAPCHTHLQLYNNNSRHSHIHSSYRSWWICSTHWRPPSRTAPWPLAPWANATLWVTRPSLVSPSSRATCAPTATRRTSACSATCATLTQTACVRSVAAASSASWDRKLPQFIEHLKAYTNLASSFSSFSLSCCSYATSYVLGRSSNGSFENLYDAGRRGRSGFDCRQLYLECNEV